MTSKEAIKLGATGALAVFGAQAAHASFGKPTGLKGIGLKVLGGGLGVWLAGRLA